MVDPNTPQARYRQHKRNAGQREIPFDLTFEEWWDIWKDRFPQRGVHRGQMQMCRTGDVGGYDKNNVRIDTVEANRREQERVQLKNDIATAWVADGRDQAKSRNWVYSRGRATNDYFSERIRMEQRIEDGELLDDDEYA